MKKVIVFGSTGFIGGHVAEQLHMSGYDVTAAVRDSSKCHFLQRLGLRTKVVDFSNPLSIRSAIEGHQIVFNCTAASSLDMEGAMEDHPEILLAQSLAEAAAIEGALRFVQLSTIVIYGFQSQVAIEETYPTQAEFPIQHLYLLKEKAVTDLGRRYGMETIILRPASAIGARDVKSFFARLYMLHKAGQYPIVGKGETKVSLVDVRDIGRAMAWLGEIPLSSSDDGIYNVKGFNTTWFELKKEMDRVAQRDADIVTIPETLTDEELGFYRLNRFAFLTFKINRIWNDDKLIRTGFQPAYSLTEAVETEIMDLEDRMKANG